MGNCLSTCCRDSDYKGYERISGETHASRPDDWIQEPCTGAEAEAFQTRQDDGQVGTENDPGPGHEDYENRVRPTIQEQQLEWHHSKDEVNTEQTKEGDNQNVDITENEPVCQKVGESQNESVNEKNPEKLSGQAERTRANETAGKEGRGSTVVCCADNSLLSTTNGLQVESVRNLHVFKVDVVVKTHNIDNTKNETSAVAAGSGEEESARNQEDKDDEQEMETETGSGTGVTMDENGVMETHHVHVHNCQSVQMEACSTTLHVHMEHPELQYIRDQDCLKEAVENVLWAKVLWKQEQEVKYRQKYRDEKRRGMKYVEWCQAEMRKMEEELEEDRRRGEQQLKEVQKQGQERVKAITEQLMERLTFSESRRTESELERVQVVEQLAREQKEAEERVTQLVDRLQAEERNKEIDLATLRVHYEEEKKKEQEKVMTFVLRLENRDEHLLQDFAAQQLTEENLSEMVTRLYVDHNIRLLGVDCGLTFLMEAPEAQWRSIVENKLQIQTTLSQLLSEEVQEGIERSEITQCSGTEDVDIRLGQPVPTDLCMDTCSYEWSFSGEYDPVLPSQTTEAAAEQISKIPFEGPAECARQLALLGDEWDKDIQYWFRNRHLLLEKPAEHEGECANIEDPGTAADLPVAEDPGTAADLPVAEDPGTAADLPVAEDPGTAADLPVAEDPGTAADLPVAEDPGTAADLRPVERKGVSDDTEDLGALADPEPVEQKGVSDDTEDLGASADQEPVKQKGVSDDTEDLGASTDPEPVEQKGVSDDTEDLGASADPEVIADGGSSNSRDSVSRYEYDVFVACSDDSSILYHLRDFEINIGLRFFIPARDAIPGKYVSNITVENMDSSRAILFIFDASFLEDESCKLQLSYGMKISEERKTPVVIILADDTPYSEFYRDAHAAMRLYPCFKWSHAERSDALERFWMRVRLELLKDKTTIDVDYILKYRGYKSQIIARFMTLKPGDIILTGTPPGVGVFRKPPEFLKEGDVVEVGIEGIGNITNKVV